MATSTSDTTQAVEEAEADLFADALNLEQAFYTEGYNLGVRDGEAAGRREGRAFGMEKGFENFAAMGRLAGRAAVWRARLESSETSETSAANNMDESGSTSGTSGGDGGGGGGGGAAAAAADGSATPTTVERLVVSDRTRRQIVRLCALTDPDHLAMENSEEAVDAFDARLREAKSKAALVARAVGERGEVLGGSGDDHHHNNNNTTYDIDERNGSASRAGRPALRVVDDGRNGAGLGAGEMEDFAGLPGTRR